MHNYTTACNADGIWSLSVLDQTEHETIQISTHLTETEALEAMVDAIVEEKRIVQSNLNTTRNRHETTERNRNALRSLVEGLPWNDITSGEFCPAPGCGDVAIFRDSAIDLGCDSATINYGADRAFTIDAEVTLRVSFTIHATSEETAHDTAEAALEACENEWRGCNSLDDFCIDGTSECITAVEEC